MRSIASLWSGGGNNDYVPDPTGSNWQESGWKYGSVQNHDSDELMQNGILISGDKFDIIH